MTKNRIIPYGYQLEMGKTVIHKVESIVVKRIYSEYALGSSYKIIAEMLTTEGIVYNINKPVWNKNMVARILQNEKYLGTEIYPTIIDTTLKEGSEKAQKKYTKTESEVIKNIKPLLKCSVCGAKLKRRHKTNGEVRWFCEIDKTHISNRLSDIILEDFIKELFEINLKGYMLIERLTERNTKEVVELQNEIDYELKIDNIDTEKLSEKIKRLAEMKYLNLKPTLHYKQKCLEELTESVVQKANLIKEIVREIIVGKNGIEELTLIDGVTIEG